MRWVPRRVARTFRVLGAIRLFHARRERPFLDEVYRQAEQDATRDNLTRRNYIMVLGTTVFL